MTGVQFTRNAAIQTNFSRSFIGLVEISRAQRISSYHFAQSSFALNLAFAETFFSFAQHLIFHFNFLNFKKAWAIKVTPFPGLKSHVEKYSIPWKNLNRWEILDYKNMNTSFDSIAPRGRGRSGVFEVITIWEVDSTFYFLC